MAVVLLVVKVKSKTKYIVYHNRKLVIKTSNKRIALSVYKKIKQTYPED